MTIKKSIDSNATPQNTFLSLNEQILACCGGDEPNSQICDIFIYV